MTVVCISHRAAQLGLRVDRVMVSRLILVCVRQTMLCPCCGMSFTCDGDWSCIRVRVARTGTRTSKQPHFETREGGLVCCQSDVGRERCRGRFTVFRHANVKGEVAFPSESIKASPVSA